VIPDASARLRDELDRLRPVRRPTRVVRVGDVPVGGDEPIRVQSMTTAFTHDVEATLGQIERLAAAGCELVRVTVPTMRDAEALPAIRAGMAERGVAVPLVADIHFSPKLALLAVEHVEKVRVNPGNFTDKKRFEQRTYSDDEYAAELVRIADKFRPLVLRARERGVAMRIGTNHGSLSDRVVNRYGDSPRGMVESALEFVRICREHDYHELIISMKASNTRVMIEAYRLLARQMAEEGMDYPFHLGVTEAGDGDDARIKSAIGIGSLLQDGIGDTIRVSLTEDPVAEVPVGFGLARRAGPGLVTPELRLADPEAARRHDVDPVAFARRPARRVEQGTAAAALGADQEVRVEVALGRAGALGPERLRELARELAGPDAGDRKAEVLRLEVAGADDIAALDGLRDDLAAEGVAVALDARAAPPVWTDVAARAALLEAVDRLTPVEVETRDVAALAAAVAASEERALLLERPLSGHLGADVAALVAGARVAVDAGLDGVAVGLVHGAGEGLLPPPAVRALVGALAAAGLDLPIVLTARAAAEGDDGLLDAATEGGALLVDGVGDALRVEGPGPERAVALAYGILQGARRRTTQTEYISCPGCGRTLFELEPVTARIKAKTAHLKGVKIAVMGCIVNGPGEMADADFGYVGWKPGKVNLYVGKECVVREVPEDEAPDRLVELIKQHGRWNEPTARPLPVA